MGIIRAIFGEPDLLINGKRPGKFGKVLDFIDNSTDTIGQYASQTLNDMTEDLRDVQKYRDEFEYYSDNKVLDLYKKTSGSSSKIEREKHMACMLILKERGIIEK